MLHEVHEVLGKVLHGLGGGIRADVPGGAVGSHSTTAVVRTIKRLAKIPVGHEFMMMMGKGMRPLMAKELPKGAALNKTEFGQDTRSCHGWHVDVTGGTVVLPAETPGSKRSQPHLNLRHGITPKAKPLQLTEHMPVISSQPRQCHEPHCAKERIIRGDCWTRFDFCRFFTRRARVASPMEIFLDRKLSSSDF